MDVTEAAQPQLPQPSPTPSKKVSFAAATHEQGPSPTPPRGASPDGKAASAAPGAACPELLHSNALFSPERQGSWTIEAQRPDRMEDPAAGGEAGPSPSPSPLPSSIGLASGGGAYTPASSTWLESARKVADLQDRLAGLEAALKDMESKVGWRGWRVGRGRGAAARPGRDGGWPLMRRAARAHRTDARKRAQQPALISQSPRHLNNTLPPVIAGRLAAPIPLPC